MNHDMTSILSSSKKYAHHGWHLGVTKTGAMKNGRRTFYPWGQKAILFVQRRPFSDPFPLKQIVNRHGFKLAILADGKVKGERSESLIAASREFLFQPQCLHNPRDQLRKHTYTKSVWGKRSLSLGIREKSQKTFLCRDLSHN